MSPSKIVVCWLFAACALAGGAAHAKQYAIEIVVFARPPAQAAKAAEQWDFGSARVAERAAAMRDLAEKAGDHPKSARLYGLAGVRDDLVAAGYRILNTTSWQQPTSTYRYAPLVALGGDSVVDGAESVLGDGAGDAEVVVADGTGSVVTGAENVLGDGGDSVAGNPENTAANSTLTAAEIALAAADFDLAAGFVRVYTTSLIHADLHLQLAPPLPESAPPDAPHPRFFITEKRRLKFKQIHYFDHPLFGAILGLWEEKNDAEG